VDAEAIDADEWQIDVGRRSVILGMWVQWLTNGHLGLFAAHPGSIN